MRVLESLMTIDSIRQAIGSIFRAMEAHHQELNELDGKLGDGDLGVTLLKAFTELERIKGGLPEDLGQALMQCASALTKVSSSSFGTLLATGLITSAKSLRGITAAECDKTAGILESVVPALLARGKSSLGDKTVVDGLAAIAKDIAGQSDPETIAQAAAAAVERTLNEFREKPAKVGRALIFGERSIGLDDPGMVALRVMVNALA